MIGAARRVVVVAGMHRAGTSVVARALQALGVDLGERLMSADVRMNARGFFEDLDIVALDDALLASCGADWKSVAPLTGVDWAAPAHASARRDAVTLLDARLARGGLFGFKDPRSARLLPFWQRAITDAGATDAYVIAVRHPLSVVASLTARDRLDPRRSAWLWLVHLISALHHTQGRPRVVVDYDRLLEAPRRELARMAQALGFAAALDSEGVAAYIGDFLSAELRHAEHRPDDVGAMDLVPLVGEAQALAQRLARGDIDASGSEAMAAIAALHARLQEHEPLLAYAGDVEREADTVGRLAGELDWAQRSLADAKGYVNELRGALARQETDAHADRDASQKAIAVAVTYSDSLRTALAGKERELAQARNPGLFARIGARLDRWRERLLPQRPPGDKR